jgi:mannose-6-phosphate isomerase-like protein (cupin superfamily)
MSGSPLPLADARALLAAVPFDVERVQKRLEAGGGGYRIVHASPGLEIGVYVLSGSRPDHQHPHADDEVYIVLDGRGVLDVEGTQVPLEHGQAVFVPAGARHQFTAYDHLSVLVIFARRWRLDQPRAQAGAPA